VAAAGAGEDECTGALSHSRAVINGDSIIDCNSIGCVFGTTYAGRLIGYKGITTVLNSFWFIQTSSQLISDSGISRSTAEMQTAGTFLKAGWDFVDETANGIEDIWWILGVQDYSRLWLELITDDY
jgi:hypothetical protein